MGLSIFQNPSKENIIKSLMFAPIRSGKSPPMILLEKFTFSQGESIHCSRAKDLLQPVPCTSYWLAHDASITFPSITPRTMIPSLGSCDIGSPVQSGQSLGL